MRPHEHGTSVGAVAPAGMDETHRLPPVGPPMRGRIALFLPSLEGGGAERVFVNLANQFVTWDYAVDLVLARAGGPYTSLLDPRVRVVDLAVPVKPAVVPALAAYLRRARPAVLLSAMDIYNIAALLARRLALAPVPVVVSCQFPISGHARLAGRVQDHLLPALARLLYPSADRVVAASAGVASDVAQSCGLPPETIEVVHNPVALTAVRARMAEPLDHPWLAAGAPPVIVGVGRLVPQKDFPTLLRAFARLARPARLIILGEGGERPALEALARELGIADRLAMPGFVDNPFAYLARAQLFVLSSVSEGFGLVVAEALACGCPVVSTDCPSGPAEILAEGRYGALVPVGDPAALAGAIEAALKAPVNREELRRRAADFAVERIAARYLEVFDGCVEKAARRQ